MPIATTTHRIALPATARFTHVHLCRPQRNRKVAIGRQQVRTLMFQACKRGATLIATTTHHIVLPATVSVNRLLQRPRSQQLLRPPTRRGCLPQRLRPPNHRLCLPQPTTPRLLQPSRRPRLPPHKQLQQETVSCPTTPKLATFGVSHISLTHSPT
jgi:hypothetical protein